LFNRNQCKNHRGRKEPENQGKKAGKYYLAFFTVVASGSNLSTNSFGCKDNTFCKQTHP
jgi:hypothetical protein